MAREVEAVAGGMAQAGPASSAMAVGAPAGAQGPAAEPDSGLASLLDQLRALGPARIVAVGLVLFGFLAFFAYLGARALEPRYTLLFGGLEMEDSSAVLQRLDAMGVPYRLTSTGDAVMVPADQVLRLRMALADEGLPGGSVVGYEIFDSGDSFGTTDFLSNVNLKRALEGELARTIGSLRQVRAARVHLVQPRRQLFEREREEPTASVFLSMRGNNNLAAREIASIRHLVAAAVPGLDPRRVTVLDDAGTLLARGGEADGAGFGLDETESFRRGQEERLKQKIVALLERSIGVGRVDAEVNLQMAFDEVSTTQELFDPESQVARSTQTVEEANDRNERDPKDAVGVSGNLPTGDAADGEAATTAEESSRTEETVNYEISRTVRNETRRGGRIERLSIAVQVDGIQRTDENGDTVYQPRDEAELDELETLVRTAAGIDDERGDTVSVISRQFVAAAEVEPIEEPGFLDLAADEYRRFGELGLIGLIALLVLVLGVRPALRRLIPEREPSTRGPAPLVAGPHASVMVGQDGQPLLVHVDSGTTISVDAKGRPIVLRGGQPVSFDDRTDEAGGSATTDGSPSGTAGPSNASKEAKSGKPAASVPPEEDERIDLAQIDGSVRAALINQVSEVIENHPDDALRVIRGWLQTE
ncbi:MAG: flagellar M-ring protein FliF [Geminicoccaceae bacterium]|nr:flagellar M-ring protein FliF [Geminicoccaceae bacterium]